MFPGIEGNINHHLQLLQVHVVNTIKFNPVGVVCYEVVLPPPVSLVVIVV